MFINDIDPVLLAIGPLEIRYYGLMYIVATLITYYMLLHLSKKKKINMNAQEVGDYITWVLVGVIVGGRLFYCLVYNPGYFFERPLEVLYVWNGGMSFHGGLLGAVCAIFFFARKYKKSFLELGDATSIPIAIGLFFGRIGNFLNSELYGSTTSLPWGVNFLGEKDTMGNLVYRHPSQLYEAAKNILIFGVLWNLSKKKRPQGTILFSFMLMYGILRFAIEYIRLPDPQIGYIAGFITMGQILCIPLVLIGAYGLWHVQKRPHSSPDN